MEFEHVPVLFNEVMEALDIKPDGIYVDGTVGGGGHSSGICQRLTEGGVLIAVDRDREALAAAEKRLEEYSCEKRFVHANYSDVEAIAAAAGKKAVFKVRTNKAAQYQWQYKKTGGKKWKKIKSTGTAKTPNLKIKATEKKNGYKYRCKITFGKTVVYSKTVSLKVK